MTGNRTVVIGVGNPYRRDDGFGPMVVSLLVERRLPGLELATCDGEPTRLIDLWTGARLAVVVDAVRTEPARPGRVHRLSAYHPAVAGGAHRAAKWVERSVPRGAAPAASSHAIGLGEAVDLARALDRLPERLLLFAVETDRLDFGVGLSEPVAEAAVAVAAEVAELVRAPEVS